MEDWGKYEIYGDVISDNEIKDHQLRKIKYLKQNC